MKIAGLPFLVLAVVFLAAQGEGYAGCSLHEESSSEGTAAASVPATVEQAELSELAEE